MSPELEEFYADLAASQETPREGPTILNKSFEIPLGFDISEAPPEAPVTVNDILVERGSRYGSFEAQARLTQSLQQTFYTHMMAHQQTSVPPYMIEALNMIFHKLARIANGDPFYIDSWTDISGYSQLVVDILQTQQKGN